MAFEDHAEELLALLGPRAITAVTAAAVEAGWQNTLGYPVTVSIPAATAGTCEIQVSLDGVTYTTLEAARAVAASGGPNVNVAAAPGVYVKLTPTTSVLSNGYAY